MTRPDTETPDTLDMALARWGAEPLPDAGFTAAVMARVGAEAQPAAAQSADPALDLARWTQAAQRAAAAQGRRLRFGLGGLLAGAVLAPWGLLWWEPVVLPWQAGPTAALTQGLALAAAVGLVAWLLQESADA